MPLINLTSLAQRQVMQFKTDHELVVVPDLGQQFVTVGCIKCCKTEELRMLDMLPEDGRPRLPEWVKDKCLGEKGCRE